MSDTDKAPSGKPWPPQERRRQQDRRQAGRQGKYDRRRNRCVHCALFVPETSDNPGYCRAHDVAMAADAFACPQFKPVETR